MSFALRKEKPRDVAQRIRERIDGGGAKGARQGPPPSTQCVWPSEPLPPLAAHLTAF